jgi:hypothetical protein
MQTEKQKTILDKNLTQLKSFLVQQLINKIQSAKKSDHIDLFRSTDGSLNATIQYGNHKSSFYPIDGWEGEVEKRLKNMNFNKNDATIIVGIGLGYFLKGALNKADKKHKFIVIESDVGLIKLALQNIDFSEEIKEKRIFFAVEKDDCQFLLDVLNDKEVIDDWVIIVEGYTIKNMMYTKLTSDVAAALNQVRCNIGTISLAGFKMAQNDILNLPYIIHKRGVAELENIYKDETAIIVSTGPSLEKNIWQLKDWQNKAVIIAVGQAMRPLLAYDVTPDFVCSVDFGDVNMTHYDGLTDTDIPLVTLNRSYAPLLTRWKGPMFVSTAPASAYPPEHKDSIQVAISDKGATLQSGSVSHMAFGLAVHMGFKNIIIIGQDLAYTTERSHIAQADSGGKITSKNGGLRWEVTDPRCPIENKEDVSMGMMITTEGYFNNIVQTTASLLSFKHGFEMFFDIYNKDRNIINATEGGAHIRGSRRMTLKRAIERYGKDIDNKKDRIKHLLSDMDNPFEYINGIIPKLKNEHNLLKTLKKTCRLGLRYNEEITEIINVDKPKTNDNKKLDNALKHNKEHSKKAHSMAISLPLVQMAIYAANRRVQHSSLNVKGTIEHLKSDIEDFKIRVARNKIILDATLDATIELIKSYEITIKKLDRASKLKDLTLLVDKHTVEPEPTFDDVEIYFNDGNFARPLLDCKKYLKKYYSVDKFGTKDCAKIKETNEKIDRVIKIYERAARIKYDGIEKQKKLPDQSDYIDSLQLVEDAQILGRDEKKYEEALDLLEQAMELDPNEMAMWGVATSLMHCGKYDKSIEYYHKLVKMNSNARYKFELGQVYISNNKIIDGLKWILDAMDQSDEFDSFNRVIGDLFYGFKEYEEALKYYRIYLEKFPFDTEAWERAITISEFIVNGSLDDNKKESYIIFCEKAKQHLESLKL